MKKIKYLLPIILTLTVIMTIFVVSHLPAKAEETSGTCGDNVTWNFDEATGTLTISGSGKMTDYSYSLSSSAPWNSIKSSIKTVKISEGVTSIGDYAFWGCESLTNITVPDSVTSIGENAFTCCFNLTSITIPDSVTSIGKDTFMGCESLTSITIPNSVISIGYSAFYGCISLTSINIPDSVTSIGDYAFAGCEKLKNVTIGNGVTSIGSYAFWDCESLTNIVIPEDVTNIADYAFYDCSNLKTIYISSSNIAENLTSSNSCGELIYYADTVCIKSTITNIPDYITTNYPYTAMTTKNGVTYTAYSKNPIEHMCYYGTEWSSDTNNHWHECSCGEKFELAAHSWNDGEITVQPSVESEGEKTFTCTVCSSTKTEKLDKIEVPDEPDTPNTPEEPDVPEEDKKDSTTIIIIILAVVIVALIGVCLVLITKNKKK